MSKAGRIGIAASLAVLVFGISVIPASAELSPSPSTESQGEGSVPAQSSSGADGSTSGAANGRSQGGPSAAQPETRDGDDGESGGLPTHLVNGNFDYPDQKMLRMPDTGWAWADIARESRSVFTWDDRWNPLPDDFDSAKFGWDSTQSDPDSGRTDQIEQRKDAIELQRVASDTDNVYAELCADEFGTGIYQDISTKPGTVYNWSLKHTSMNSSWLDKMSVMIGAPGQETSQDATRTSTNGAGDTEGQVGPIIATKVSESNSQGPRQWETYTGSYTVPAGQTTTRFTFKSMDSSAPNGGNDLDDIEFGIQYIASLDPNGGTWSTGDSGSGDSSVHDKPLSAGGAFSDHVEPPTKPGYSFVGWSESQLDPVAGAEEHDKTVKDDVIQTMPDKASNLYAVWVKNPKLCASTGPAADAVPTPDCRTVVYGTPNNTFDGWDNGSTSLWGDHRFVHWDHQVGADGKDSQDGTDSGTAYDSTAPLTDDTYLIAKWDAKATGQAFPNGGSGEAKEWVGSKSDGSLYYGEDIVNAPTDPDYGRPGYKFNGWNTAADGSGTSYESGAPVTLVDGGNNLFAQWLAQPSSLQYGANGGTGSVQGVQGVTDQTVSLASNGFTRSGFEFKGWNTKADGSGTAYQPGDTYSLPANGGTLYAQWRPVVTSLPLTGGTGVMVASGVGALLVGALALVLGVLRRRYQ